MISDNFQKNRFFWKSNCTYNLWTKSHPAPFCCCNTVFLTPLSEITRCIRTHYFFYQYLLNFRSNMHVNFVYWISLLPKKAIYLLFGLTPHFISEKQKPRTNNLHHRKAGSVAVILSLRVGVQHLQKVALYVFQCGCSQMYTLSCKASYWQHITIWSNNLLIKLSFFLPCKSECPLIFPNSF